MPHPFLLTGPSVRAGLVLGAQSLAGQPSCLRCLCEDLVVVTTGWMQPLLRGLPVTAQQLREDRILEEAAVTGADPEHLCAVFNITPETGLRYIRFFQPDPTDSDDVSGCDMETS